MTYPELQIQFDLNPGNLVNILQDVDTCSQIINIGYLFVDSENGQCHLFDINGNEHDIDEIKSIGDYVFLNCVSLTSISIPDSVEIIGSLAFYDCPSLKEVIFKGKTMKQVKAMENYPWGIEDESVIKYKAFI